MTRKNKVRLSDIAEKLNISTVTVSNALAGKDGVGDELRQRIFDCAKELGYDFKKNKKNNSYPNLKTGIIGIVAPTHFFDKNGSFYWTLYNAVSKELQEHSCYAIIEQLSEEDEKNLVLPGIISDEKVDGIIVMGQVTEKYAKFFSENYKNFIFLDFSSGNLQADSVTSDNFYLEYLMTRHLIDKGHRNLRFVGSFNSTSSIKDRFMGFAKAMLEKNLTIKIQDIIPDRDDKGIFISPSLPEELPTAFVCNCDECAIRVINGLRQRGVRVPEDIAVVGFDDFYVTSYEGPALTTVAVDFAAMARTVTDLLLRKITGQPYNKGCTVIGGHLVFRESDGYDVASS